MLDDNVFRIDANASAANRQAVIDRVNAATNGEMMTFEPVQIPADSSMGSVAATNTPVFVGVRPDSQIDFFVNVEGAHYRMAMPPEIARQVGNILIETSIRAETSTVQMATFDATRTHIALFMMCREQAKTAADALEMHERMLQEAANFQAIAEPDTQMQLLATLFQNRNQVGFPDSV
jgi:hypothetical protein